MRNDQNQTDKVSEEAKALIKKFRENPEPMEVQIKRMNDHFETHHFVKLSQSARKNSEAKTETDEDYQTLGEIFSEDE